MKKFNKAILKGKLGVIMLVILSLLFVTGNALGSSPLRNLPGSSADIQGADAYEGDDGDWDDGNWDEGNQDYENWDVPELEEICVEVAGVTGDDVEFVIVPNNVKGPEEAGFDMDSFFQEIVGGGSLYEGEIFAYYFDDESKLADPGVKVYKVEYDALDMDEETTPEQWLESIKISLVSGTTVNKINCPEPLPEPEEICVEVSGVTGDEVEFVILPADVKGPAEEGFDMDSFFNAVIGGGGIYQGDSFAFYYGTKEQLREVKVYRYEFDEDAIEVMDLDALLASIKVTLIPNAAVTKIQCPEFDMEGEDFDME